MFAQEETERILCRLIEHESISARSNRDIIEYIREYLYGHGIACRLFRDSTGTKAALLATIGPPDRPGVVLSAHTDVVPAAGQAWSNPPFVATRRDGRLYGRGTTDMKGFIASALAHVMRFRESASETPVHIALSYDEEVGCRGVADLVAAVAALPARPALCIVGEPTGLHVVRAHKGKVAHRIIVRGRGGHSALPHRAANAVIAAARIAHALADHAARLTQSGPCDDAFDPPWTTLHVGSLHGGSALNIVPDHAELEFEIRAVPGTAMPVVLTAIDVEVEAVRADLKRQAPEAEIVVEEMAAYPALATAANDAAVVTVARLARDDKPAGAVSFGTEAGFYAAVGIPTVVCGPGDIARAHKADEWIGLDELAASDEMMQRLASMLHRPAADWIKS